MAHKKPVTIRGVTYESRAEAARALGITPTAVTTAVRNNWTDRAGEGRRQPVTIRGVEYVSHTQAAHALGVGVSAVGKAVAAGTTATLGVLAAARREAGL